MSDPNQRPPSSRPAGPRPPEASRAPRSTSSTAAQPGWPSKARPVVDVVGRMLCLLVGGALAVAALVGLFLDVAQGELIAVLCAGLFLLIVPSIVDSISSRRLGYPEVHLIRQIATTARRSAEKLRRLGLEQQLDAYATIYTELRGPELKAVRGEVLDRVAQRVANAAAVEKFDQDEVKDLFLHGSPIVRVLALGLMEGDLSLVDGAVLLDAVNRSLTGNELYHALRIVRNGWGWLSPDERHKLLAAIDANPYIEHGPDKRVVAQQIRELAGSSRIG